MKAIHELCVIHRDLKPDNLLFNNDGEIVISDFGICKMLLNNDSMTTSLAGTD